MKKYRRQSYPWTCQMISAANAAIYYGKKVPSQRSKVWQTWIDEVCARVGAALYMDKMFDKLSLCRLPIESDEFAIKKALKFGFPVEMAVNLKWSGYHSILLLPSKKYCVRVCGWNPDRSVCTLPLKYILRRGWKDVSELNRRTNIICEVHSK